MASTLGKIKTIKSGRAYRAIIDGTAYFFEVDQDTVLVRTKAHRFGGSGWKLERFGGTLSPATLRAFLRDTWPVA